MIQRNENTRWEFKRELGFRVVAEILLSGIGARNTWAACEPMGCMRAHAADLAARQILILANFYGVNSSITAYVISLLRITVLGIFLGYYSVMRCY